MPDAVPALETFRVWIREVPITPENPSGIVVEPDRFRVSKVKDTTRLQVMWIGPSDGFTIKFKHDSPFTESQFTPSTPGSVISGPVRDDVQSDGDLPEDKRKDYRYTVKIGSRVLDPGGVVDP
jgi:hypothetical protein